MENAWPNSLLWRFILWLFFQLLFFDGNVAMSKIYGVEKSFCGITLIQKTYKNKSKFFILARYQVSIPNKELEWTLSVMGVEQTTTTKTLKAPDITSINFLSHKAKCFRRRGFELPCTAGNQKMIERFDLNTSLVSDLNSLVTQLDKINSIGRCWISRSIFGRLCIRVNLFWLKQQRNKDYIIENSMLHWLNKWNFFAFLTFASCIGHLQKQSAITNPII